MFRSIPITIFILVTVVTYITLHTSSHPLARYNVTSQFAFVISLNLRSFTTSTFALIRFMSFTLYILVDEYVGASMSSQ